MEPVSATMKFREAEIFSEHWHWLAPKRFALDPLVNVHRQSFRGNISYIVEDPVSGRFIRLNPALYELVRRLDGLTSLGDLWEDYLRREPSRAPGQQEVVNCISQLHSAGVLTSDTAVDAGLLFRKHENDARERRNKKLLQFLFIRVPLINPDRFLKRTEWFGKFLFSRLMGLVWLAVVAAGLVMAASNLPRLLSDSSSIFDPGNWLSLYVVWALVKVCHEFGHAWACRSRGGQVSSIGVMLLVLLPIPYVDTTSVWRLRAKSDRVLVASAGMMVEFFIAAIALFIWSQTSADSDINQIAYNVIFLASVSTLLFNLNPLLRFDGYYIFSDLLETPNLQSRSITQLRYYLERYVFRLYNSPQPGYDRRESALYAGFGIASGLYRIFIFLVILLFVAEQFWGLGILIALVGGYIMMVMPVIKFIRYLASETRLEPVRSRVNQVCFVTLAAVFIGLAVLPFPRAIVAPAMVLSHETELIYAPTDGVIASLPANGEWVEANTPLLDLDNQDFRFELLSLEAKGNEYQAMRDWAMMARPDMLGALDASLEANQSKQRNSADNLAKLTIASMHSGTWVTANEQDLFVGRVVKRGEPLGQVLNPNSPRRVSIIISQQQASALFEQAPNSAVLRLKGMALEAINLDEVHILANQKQALPDPAMGWAGGGAIAVDQMDPEGRRTLEPFYEVTALMPAGTTGIDSANNQNLNRWLNRTGRAKLSLSPEPIAMQVYRWARQLFQRRLRL